MQKKIAIQFLQQTLSPICVLKFAKINAACHSLKKGFKFCLREKAQGVCHQFHQY
jgi:hypothetical protein